jgi:hypothetical protein
MTTKEMIEVMQAYADGKGIERRCKHDLSEKWEDAKDPGWNWNLFDYRIKPEKAEPRYRPYKDTDEMIADWKERFKKNWSGTSMPLIWIWDNDKVEKTLVTGFRWKDISTKDEIITMTSLFEFYTYLDGSPCGKEVTE